MEGCRIRGNVSQSDINDLPSGAILLGMWTGLGTEGKTGQDSQASRILMRPADR